MSDTGNSSPRALTSSGADRLTAGVIQKPVRTRANSQHNRSRHRATPARVHLKNFVMKYEIILFVFSYKYHGLVEAVWKI